jgi:hypothetical protein
MRPLQRAGEAGGANVRAMRTNRHDEPRWHAAVAVLLAIALYVTLPPRLAVGPLWLLPVLLLVIMVPLNVVAPRRRDESIMVRTASITVVAILNVFNVLTIVLLFADLLSPRPHRTITGELLLLAAVQIWLTNVIVYALWYWEIDGSGPDEREDCSFEELPLRTSFLFPQMAMPSDLRARMRWRPRIIDYVFLSFNTATAFSPTDTFPLTPLAKMLMMGESLTSLITIAVIAGRAINILGAG